MLVFYAAIEKILRIAQIKRFCGIQLECQFQGRYLIILNF